MSDNGQRVPLPGCMIGPSEPCDAFQRQTARIAELEAQLAERTRERDVARLYCAEVANYVCDPMYDKAENRAGIALDAEAMATGVMTGRYLDIKTQTDRAIKAEAERDALRADAERFAWWFSFAPKPDWFVMQYLQGVCEKFTLDQWRYAIDAARLAVEQDRAQREKREPHRALLALQKDGYVDVNSDDDHAQHLIVLRWTPKRVWIESEKNRELARILRKHYYNSELAFDVADDLDGGKR